MIDWALSAILTSSLISVAAALVERAVRLRFAPTRLVWFGAVLTSLLLPLLPYLSAFIARADGLPPSTQTLRFDAAAIQLPHVLPAAVASAEQGAVVTPDLAFKLLWLTASVAIVCFLCIQAARIHRRKGTWELRDAIYVSRDTGPAVFGFLRPSIVVPAWFHDLPPDQQLLALSHERSHIAARDPALLLTGFIAIAAAPWNVPLWWLFTRLRRAIELDCDQRVLGAGANRRSYGATLIAVAERSARPLGIALSAVETKSLLQRRIMIMSESSPRTSRLRAFSLFGAAALIAIAAAQVRSADQPPVLARYAGVYQYSQNTVMHVVRKDDHLQVRFTGQDSADDIYAQGPASFFYSRPDVHASIEFTADAAILRQNGAETSMQRLDQATADAIETAVAQRVARQSADVGSEAALRRLVMDIYAGTVDLSLVNPQLAGALRNDLPKLQLRLAQLGRPSSYALQRVSPSGSDEYLVTHERGTSEWSVVVDAQGVITSATVPL